jgi:Rrf2 family protein
MKLSKKSEYALRALVQIALRKGESVRLADLSRAEHIPYRFLQGILRDLITGGILRSKRGVGGGYELNKAPQQITLGEILRFLDGPIVPVACVDGSEQGRPACGRGTTCGLRQVMQDAVGALTGVLDQTTLETVCALTRRLESAGGLHVGFESSADGLA